MPTPCPLGWSVLISAGVSVTLSASVHAFEPSDGMATFPGPPLASTLNEVTASGTSLSAPTPETGMASFYWRKLAGRLTANGERFDPDALTMAHRTLPFGTRVQVRLVGTRRSVLLRVNDRGPFTGGRIADLSPAAARQLGVPAHGTVMVRLEIVSEAAEFPQASSPTDR